MKALLIAACLAFTCSVANAQQYSLGGEVTDTVSAPIPYTSVSLLHPEDSTLASFGITNASGQFEIKNIEKGTYLLQAAFLGFRTYYKRFQIPADGNSTGRIVLKAANNLLNEVEVTGEKVPLMIKGDTIEYNSGAFKTKPDANVEELLKKLPGVEVDRAGNIKAQGEDVRKVLVDGKEFFSDDPKVATKNLPADAIGKIQVFNKRSDATEFTGIDDGTRDKTINLQLKDGKKSGYFGDVTAGGGTDEHYKFGGKLYKFRKQSQFAALGMYNNINQSGFSFQDYLSFNGGIRSLLSGNGNLQIDLNGRNNIPVDFGQPVNGLIRSGAGGLNYSYEPKKNQRIAVSYLGNGSAKDLIQQVHSVYSLPEGYVKNDDATDNSNDMAHRFNLSARKDVDSAYQLTLYSNVSLTHSRSTSQNISVSSLRESVLNRLDNKVNDNGNGITASAHGGYVKQNKGAWSVYKLSAEGNYQKDLTKSQWQNITSFPDSGFIMQSSQFRNETKENADYSVSSSIVRSLGNGYYIEPGISIGNNIQKLQRKQGVPPNETVVIDSLSPEFSRQYTWLRPGIDFQHNYSKKQLHMNVDVEMGYLTPRFVNAASTTADYVYILPALEWQNEYSNNKRVGLSYRSSVNTPAAEQMMAVVNNVNPVQRYIGNSALKPEYSHNMRLNWLWFDQFSFTSLFTNLDVRYTHDKISLSRTIDNDLVQTIMPVNTTDNYNANARVEFSRPVRRLGIIADVAVSENYERGISPVNTIQNITNVFEHNFSLTFSNRKKDKWDIQVGGKAGLSAINYSITKTLNNNFNNFSAFTEISFRPTDKWYFMVSADLTRYDATSFSQAVTIPLIKAEMSYYFLKANRGVLTLEGFDLLNKNTGLQRSGELNYYRETRSNVIGRYFLLSFKYRLNKLGSNKEKMDIQIKR